MSSREKHIRLSESERRFVLRSGEEMIATVIKTAPDPGAKRIAKVVLRLATPHSRFPIVISKEATKWREGRALIKAAFDGVRHIRAARTAREWGLK